jgi:hypothetical protein
MDLNKKLLSPKKPTYTIPNRNLKYRWNKWRILIIVLEFDLCYIVKYRICKINYYECSNKTRNETHFFYIFLFQKKI